MALVAAEIRFVDAGNLLPQEAVIAALGDRLPASEPFSGFGPGQAAIPPLQIQQQGTVLKNAASTERLVITPDSLTYETTKYSDFDDLLKIIAKACEALIESMAKPQLRRIGLRYIDEIRVPDPITDIRQWAKWIAPQLTAPLEVGPDDMIARVTEGIATYDLGDGRGLNIRHAALNQEPIVASSYLKRPTHSAGPFFVLDFDGFRDFSTAEAAQMTSALVTENLAAVHEHCGAAFQRSITDAARDLFRGASP